MVEENVEVVEVIKKEIEEGIEKGQMSYITIDREHGRDYFLVNGRLLPSKYFWEVVSFVKEKVVNYWKNRVKNVEIMKVSSRMTTGDLYTAYVIYVEDGKYQEKKIWEIWESDEYDYNIEIWPYGRK